MLYKYKCIRKIFICFISLSIILSQTIGGYNLVYADELTGYNPALIPMFALVSSVCVGTGIIASNASDAANELVNNVINQIKYNEVLKATSDDTYNSPYRVINSNGQPEKPNNNNKNGKWFALGAASALAGAVVGEKGMVQDIIDTVNNLGGYNSMQGGIGTFNADTYKNNSTASAIALQLANISNSSVTQFDTFLHSSWWDNKDFTPDDCYFSVNVLVSDILNNNPKYPKMTVKVLKKNTDLAFINVLSNDLSYYSFSNQYGDLDYYFINSTGNTLSFLNNDNVSIYMPLYTLNLLSRSSGEDLIIQNDLSGQTYTSIGLAPISRNGVSLNNFAYCGYKWSYKTPYGFTQNVYNSNQTIINQYPDWDLHQLELLGQQIEALNLGIQNLNNPWEATQPEIQDGLSPAEVISQILNNYVNPENAPDPEPDPDPDPDPEPYPDPVPEPVPDDTYLGEFLLPTTITEKFPFSIPFDIARCLRLFNTNSREAPRWECDLHYGNNTSHIVLDLSVFDDVAALIRPIEFIAFLVGLAYATRYLIKG